MQVCCMFESVHKVALFDINISTYYIDYFAFAKAGLFKNTLNKIQYTKS